MKITFKNYSIARYHQYKELQKLELNGSILDLGGRKNEDYHALIKGEHTFTAANLSRDRVSKDIELNVENPFPLESESFDHVIASNLLEHVFNFDNVVSETFRVLKKGGRFIISTPFFTGIHRTPSDYFRYTDEAFEKMLTKHGFTVERIEPLAYGPIRLMGSLLLPVTPTKTLKRFVKWKSNFVEEFLCTVSKSYKRKALHIPQSYMVFAKK